MDFPHIIKLHRPVTFGDQTIAEITVLREPVAGDLRGVKLSEMDIPENILLVTQRISDQPKPVLEKLSVPDLFTLTELVGGFFTDGLATGSDASA